MPTPFTTVLTRLGSLGAGPWAAGLGTSPLREEPLASGKSSQQLGQLGLEEPLPKWLLHSCVWCLSEDGYNSEGMAGSLLSI